MRRCVLMMAVAPLALGIAASAEAQQQQVPLFDPPQGAQPAQQPGAQQPGMQQQQAQPMQPGMQGEAQVAQQCLSDLRAFAERASADGYWVTGWGVGWGGMGPAVGTADPLATGTAVAPGATATGTAPPAAGPMRTPAEGVRAGAPHGPGGQPQVGGTDATLSPRLQIRTLYSAASVLGQRGNEQGCQTVLQELVGIYDGFVQDLQAAGIQPGEILTWRQEQLVAAVPVAELEHATFRVEHIVGTDLRNPRDEHLGSIEDVVLDPRTNAISHAIVAHGGFLGIGAETVAVPFGLLQVTPGMNTFVLDVPQAVLENAPEVDPDAFATRARYDEYRQTVDRYWQQAMQG